jgi:chromosome segregation ATPase
MDTNQLTQMVTWLDEEHRRDRAEQARLQQRVESLLGEIQDQARRIQDLEARLANTQAQLSRFNQLEQALTQLKNEVVVMLQKLEDARLEAERRSEQARMTEREATARAIAEIRKELSRIARLEEELQIRRAEDARLGEALLNLRQQVTAINKDIDERTRSLPYLLEQRQQDNKRIAQLQQEMIEAFKRIEAVAGRLPSLEETTQRLERSASAAQALMTELKRNQDQFMETVRLAEVERQRQMGRWTEEFAAQRELIERHNKQILQFAEQYEAAKQALGALAKFEEQIRRDQNQVAELQRLGEERQRKELLDWQAENEKRWKKHDLEWEHERQEQLKVNRDLAARFTPIQETLALLETQVAQLWHLQETYGAHRIAEAQRWLKSLEEALENRGKGDSRTAPPSQIVSGTG